MASYCNCHITVSHRTKVHAIHLIEKYAKKESGRGDRIRTCDPLVPNQMRYQAALLPDADAPIALSLALPRWARQDSNPRPSRYERPALTAELQARLIRQQGEICP